MKKPEKARHREDGECGCKYMEDEAPCEIKMEARNQAIDEYEKYHNEEIAKLETQNKRLAIRERELMEQRDKLQQGLNFYQDTIVNLGDTTLYAVEGANILKMPTTKSLTKLIDERKELQVENEFLTEALDASIKDTEYFESELIIAQENLKGK